MTAVASLPMDMQFQLLSWFLMRKLVPPEDERLVKGHYKHRSGHSRLVQEYCLMCFSGFGLTTLDIHGRNWGGCHVIPTSPLSATPSVLVLPAISCHLPDFIVGDLSLVFTTDLSKGLLTISETLRKAYDLFVILARSQFLQSLGLLARSLGVAHLAGAGSRDREWQDCWRHVPARMSLDL